MWSTDLLSHNVVDFLLDKGYDVWLVDYRMSPITKASHSQSTLDQMIYDIAAAVEKVKEICKVEKIGVISHCVGSLVVFMGLLNGEITGVGSLISSQVVSFPLFLEISTASVILVITIQWILKTFFF